MKLKIIICALGVFISIALNSVAQGTAFTYQGRLSEGASPAAGIYDLRFAIYDAASAGVLQGSALTNTATAISNGLFTVTLDFGNQFPGGGRWLEIAVRTNSGGAFTTLSPRQGLTPTPYAVTAGNLSGALPVSQLSGAIANANLPASPIFSGAVAANSFAGNGANLTNVNATSLGGMPATNFWQLGGNAVSAGQFIGTTNNQPVEVWVNNQPAVRLQPTATDATHSNIVNILNGSSANHALGGIYGATIGGGGAKNYGGGAFSNRVTGDFATVAGGRGNWSGTGSSVGGGWGNSALGSHSVVGGGQSNLANGVYSTISGGTLNTNLGDSHTIGGGVGNAVFGSSSSTISGGYDNTCSNLYATVGGGSFNRAGGLAATVPGGSQNQAVGNASFAAGYYARALHDGAFVWGDSTGGALPSTAADQFLIFASGGVGIGTASPGTSLEVKGGIRARGGAPGAGGVNDSGYAFNNNGGDTDSGMFSSANGQLEFYTDAAERARVTSAGLGVGVATVEAPLHVAPNAGGGGIIVGVDAFGGGYTALQLDVSAVSGGYAKLQAVKSSGSAFGNLVLNGAGGNVGVGALNPANLLVVGNSGSPAYCNGTTWVNGSDQNSKEAFTPINPQAMLNKVAALPITEWKYKAEPDGSRHLGPMAQDFHAAFGLNGTDNTHIATVDESGVALAAIQGLNEKVEVRSQKSEVRMQKLEAENAKLKQRLEKLEQLLTHKLP